MYHTKMKQYEIIGIIGHQGVGKNYIAEKILPNILEKKNTLCVAFADHFKITAISKYNADPKKVFGQKDFTTRKLLQRLGTEEGRNVFGKDIWIKHLETWMDTYASRGIERFIITDLRFQNEIEWVKSIGSTIIKINAPDRYHDRLLQESCGDIKRYNDIKNHPSEKDIDKQMNYDILVDNSKNSTTLEKSLIRFFNTKKQNTISNISLQSKKEKIKNEDYGYGFWG